MNKTIFYLAITMLGGAVSAFAVPTTLAVDYRSAAWKPAAGQTNYSVSNVDDTAAFPPGSILTWSSSAGVGVDAPFLLGVGNIDILNVTFGAGAGNGLTGAWVTNLFNGLVDNTGLLVLNTSTGTDFIGFYGLQTSSQNPLGDVYVDFGGAQNVTSAQFYEVNSLGGALGSKGYSVAGFSSSVPDGGTTLTLLGIGLISLTVLNRRFAA